MSRQPNDRKANAEFVVASYLHTDIISMTKLVVIQVGNYRAWSYLAGSSVT